MHRKILRFKRRVDRQRSIWRRTLREISKHPVLIPGVLLVGLCLIAGITILLLDQRNTFAVPNAYTVIISHDHQKVTVPTKEPTVGALLKKLNITLNKGDVVEPSLTTRINQADFRINVYRAAPVVIVDGNTKTFSFSAATTPRSIAEQDGLTVYPEDYLHFVPVTNFVTQGTIGQEVVIDRATPINFNLYGTPTVIRTRAATVGALLADKHIKLAKGDSVEPAVTTPLTTNLPVFVIHKGTQIQNVTQTIPMPQQVIEDASLAFGTSAVRQQGSPGQEVVTYQLNLQNGQVVGKTVLQTVVTQPPVTEIVVQGTSLSGIKGDMALAGIAPSDYQYADYIISHESGWCPTKAQGEHTCPVTPDNAYTSMGYGLCQATPGYKMQTAGSDWATNPVTQLRWCAGYAQGRYGSWYAAYSHWVAYRNW